MPEFTVKTKTDEGKTIFADLPEVGVHSYTDQGFFNRIKEIKDTLNDEWSDDVIDKIAPIENYPKTNALLKRARTKWANAAYQFAFGKASEKPRFGKAVAACRWIMTTVREDADSGADDADIALVDNEALDMIDIPVQFTFDSLNTTVNKAFTVHSQMPMQQGRVEVVSSESNPNE